eukprot:gene793-1538_t
MKLQIPVSDREINPFARDTWIRIKGADNVQTPERIFQYSVDELSNLEQIDFADWIELLALIDDILKLDHVANAEEEVLIKRALEFSCRLLRNGRNKQYFLSLDCLGKLLHSADMEIVQLSIQVLMYYSMPQGALFYHSAETDLKDYSELPQSIQEDLFVIFQSLCQCTHDCGLLQHLRTLHTESSSYKIHIPVTPNDEINSPKIPFITVLKSDLATFTIEELISQLSTSFNITSSAQKLGLRYRGNFIKDLISIADSTSISEVCCLSQNIEASTTSFSSSSSPSHSMDYTLSALAVCTIGGLVDTHVNIGLFTSNNTTTTAVDDSAWLNIVQTALTATCTCLETDVEDTNTNKVNGNENIPFESCLISNDVLLYSCASIDLLGLLCLLAEDMTDIIGSTILHHEIPALCSILNLLQIVIPWIEKILKKGQNTHNRQQTNTYTQKENALMKIANKCLVVIGICLSSGRIDRSTAMGTFRENGGIDALSRLIDIFSASSTNMTLKDPNDFTNILVESTLMLLQLVLPPTSRGLLGGNYSGVQILRQPSFCTLFKRSFHSTRVTYDIHICIALVDVLRTGIDVDPSLLGHFIQNDCLRFLSECISISSEVTYPTTPLVRSSRSSEKNMLLMILKLTESMSITSQGRTMSRVYPIHVIEAILHPNHILCRTTGLAPEDLTSIGKAFISIIRERRELRGSLIGRLSGILISICGQFKTACTMEGYDSNYNSSTKSSSSTTTNTKNANTNESSNESTRIIILQKLTNLCTLLEVMGSDSRRGSGDTLREILTEEAVDAVINAFPYTLPSSSHQLLSQLASCSQSGLDYFGYFPAAKGLTNLVKAAVSTSPQTVLPLLFKAIDETLGVVSGSKRMMRALTATSTSASSTSGISSSSFKGNSSSYSYDEIAAAASAAISIDSSPKDMVNSRRARRSRGSSTGSTQGLDVMILGVLDCVPDEFLSSSLSSQTKSKPEGELKSDSDKITDDENLLDTQTLTFITSVLKLEWLSIAVTNCLKPMARLPGSDPRLIMTGKDVLRRLFAFYRSSLLEVSRYSATKWMAKDVGQSRGKNSFFEMLFENDSESKKVSRNAVEYILKVVSPSGALIRENCDIDGSRVVLLAPVGTVLRAQERWLCTGGIVRYRCAHGWLSEFRRDQLREPIVEVINVVQVAVDTSSSSLSERLSAPPAPATVLAMDTLTMRESVCVAMTRVHSALRHLGAQLARAIVAELPHPRRQLTPVNTLSEVAPLLVTSLSSTIEGFVKHAKENLEETAWPASMALFRESEPVDDLSSDVSPSSASSSSLSGKSDKKDSSSSKNKLTPTKWRSSGKNKINKADKNFFTMQRNSMNTLHDDNENNNEDEGGGSGGEGFNSTKESVTVDTATLCLYYGDFIKYLLLPVLEDRNGFFRRIVNKDTLIRSPVTTMMIHAPEELLAIGSFQIHDMLYDLYSLLGCKLLPLFQSYRLQNFPPDIQRDWLVLIGDLVQCLAAPLPDRVDKLSRSERSLLPSPFADVMMSASRDRDRDRDRDREMTMSSMAYTQRREAQAAFVEDETMVQNLMDMGFERDHILTAARGLLTNRVELVMEFLVTHPHTHPNAAQPPQPPASASTSAAANSAANFTTPQPNRIVSASNENQPSDMFNSLDDNEEEAMEAAGAAMAMDADSGEDPDLLAALRMSLADTSTIESGDSNENTMQSIDSPSHTTTQQSDNGDADGSDGDGTRTVQRNESVERREMGRSDVTIEEKTDSAVEITTARSVISSNEETISPRKASSTSTASTPSGSIDKMKMNISSENIIQMKEKEEMERHKHRLIELATLFLERAGDVVLAMSSLGIEPSKWTDRPIRPISAHLCVFIVKLYSLNKQLPASSLQPLNLVKMIYKNITSTSKGHSFEGMNGLLHLLLCLIRNRSSRAQLLTGFSKLFVINFTETLLSILNEISMNSKQSFPPLITPTVLLIQEFLTSPMCDNHIETEGIVEEKVENIQSESKVQDATTTFTSNSTSTSIQDGTTGTAAAAKNNELVLNLLSSRVHAMQFLSDNIWMKILDILIDFLKNARSVERKLDGSSCHAILLLLGTLLTKDHLAMHFSALDGLQLIFSLPKSATFPERSNVISLIARRLFETPVLLRSCMYKSIRALLKRESGVAPKDGSGSSSGSGNGSGIPLGTFIEGSAALIARDPAMFASVSMDLLTFVTEPSPSTTTTTTAGSGDGGMGKSIFVVANGTPEDEEKLLEQDGSTMRQFPDERILRTLSHLIDHIVTDKVVVTGSVSASVSSPPIAAAAVVAVTEGGGSASTGSGSMWTAADALHALADSILALRGMPQLVAKFHLLGDGLPEDNFASYLMTKFCSLNTESNPAAAESVQAAVRVLVALSSHRGCPRRVVLDAIIRCLRDCLIGNNFQSQLDNTITTTSTSENGEDEVMKRETSTRLRILTRLGRLVTLVVTSCKPSKEPQEERQGLVQQGSGSSGGRQHVSLDAMQHLISAGLPELLSAAICSIPLHVPGADAVLDAFLDPLEMISRPKLLFHLEKLSPKSPQVKSPEDTKANNDITISMSTGPEVETPTPIPPIPAVEDIQGMSGQAQAAAGSGGGGGNNFTYQFPVEMTSLHHQSEPIGMYDLHDGIGEGDDDNDNEEDEEEDEDDDDDEEEEEEEEDEDEDEEDGEEEHGVEEEHENGLGHMEEEDEEDDDEDGDDDVDQDEFGPAMNAIRSGLRLEAEADAGSGRRIGAGGSDENWNIQWDILNAFDADGDGDGEADLSQMDIGVDFNVGGMETPPFHRSARSLRRFQVESDPLQSFFNQVDEDGGEDQSAEALLLTLLRRSGLAPGGESAAYAQSRRRGGIERDVLGFVGRTAGIGSSGSGSGRGATVVIRSSNSTGRGAGSSQGVTDLVDVSEGGNRTSPSLSLNREEDLLPGGIDNALQVRPLPTHPLLLDSVFSQNSSRTTTAQRRTDNQGPYWTAVNMERQRPGGSLGRPRTAGLPPPPSVNQDPLSVPAAVIDLARHPRDMESIEEMDPEMEMARRMFSSAIINDQSRQLSSESMMINQEPSSASFTAGIPDLGESRRPPPPPTDSSFVIYSDRDAVATQMLPVIQDIMGGLFSRFCTIERPVVEPIAEAAAVVVAEEEEKSSEIETIPTTAETDRQLEPSAVSDTNPDPAELSVPELEVIRDVCTSNVAVIEQEDNIATIIEIQPVLPSTTTPIDISEDIATSGTSATSNSAAIHIDVVLPEDEPSVIVGVVDNEVTLLEDHLSVQSVVVSVEGSSTSSPSNTVSSEEHLEPDAQSFEEEKSDYIEIETITMESASNVAVADGNGNVDTDSLGIGNNNIATVMENAPSSAGLVCPPGYDAEVFNSLPDFMQLEVIQEHQQQMNQTANSSDHQNRLLELAVASGFDAETLAALPESIRQEIFQQVEQDARNQNLFSSESPADPSHAQDMDNASFLVSLTPDLRAEVLLGSDAAFLATLPPALQAEAQLLRERAATRWQHIVGMSEGGGGGGGGGNGVGIRIGSNDLIFEDIQRASADGITRIRAVAPNGMPRRDGDGDGGDRQEILPQPRIRPNGMMTLPGDDVQRQILPPSMVSLLIRILFMSNISISVRMLHRLFFNISKHPGMRDCLLRTLTSIIMGRREPLTVPTLPDDVISQSQSQDNSRINTTTTISNNNENISATTQWPPVIVINRLLDILQHLSDSNVSVLLDMLRPRDQAGNVLPLEVNGDEESVSEITQEVEPEGISINSLLEILVGRLHHSPFVDNAQEMTRLLRLIDRVCSPLDALPDESFDVDDAASAGQESTAAVVQPNQITVPQVRMSRESLQSLCEVLLSDLCSRSVYESVSSALSRLTRVTSNREPLTAVLMDVVSELALQATTRLDSLVTRLSQNKVVSKHITAGDAAVEEYASVSTSGSAVATDRDAAPRPLPGLLAVGEVGNRQYERLLQALNTLRTLADRSGRRMADVASGESLWELWMAADKALGLIECFVQKESTGTGTASRRPQSTLSALLQRILPVIEAFFLVHSSDILSASSKSSSNDASSCTTAGAEGMDSATSVESQQPPSQPQPLVVDTSVNETTGGTTSTTPVPIPSPSIPGAIYRNSEAYHRINMNLHSDTSSSEAGTVTGTVTGNNSLGTIIPLRSLHSFRSTGSGFGSGVGIHHLSSRSHRLHSFVQQHQSLLNILIQVRPSLLDGSLSALIRITQLRSHLAFDNKRIYFFAQLRKQASRRPSGSRRTISLQVRRDSVFEDSFHQLRMRTADELRGRLSVSFHGEEGVDAGGLTREWYLVLSREIFNPNYALFTAAADGATFQPNPLSHINTNHLDYFKFVGRLIGKAVVDGHLMDAHFTRSFYKHLLGIAVDVSDMEATEPEYYKSLKQILEYPLEELGLELTFSADTHTFGKYEVIDLIPNGRNVTVTDENKTDYVRLVAHHRMTTAIRSQIDSFLQGFHDLAPAELVSIFSPTELELLICGLPDVDMDDLKFNTEYHQYRETDQVIIWLWDVLRGFSREERAMFLQFVTGTSKVPLDGFANLQGMRGAQRFSVHRSHGDVTALPSAHTCFNQLDLPPYSSIEELKEKLLMAIREGSEGFGFA